MQADKPKQEQPKPDKGAIAAIDTIKNLQAATGQIVKK